MGWATLWWTLVLWAFFRPWSSQAAGQQDCQLDTGTTSPTKLNLTVLSKYVWNLTVLDNNTRIDYYFSLCKFLGSFPSTPPECANSTACKVQNGSVVAREFNYSSKPVPTVGNGSWYWLYMLGQRCKAEPTRNQQMIFKMTCGPNLGSPEFLIQNKCDTFFLWMTSAACPTQPTRTEVPCYVYDGNGKKRDLTPLVRNSGGYSVATSVPAIEFTINVCSNIISDSDSAYCPRGTAACRRVGSEYLSFGRPTEPLKLVGQDVRLIYPSLPGALPAAACDIAPRTVITFRCPPRGRSRMPRLIADKNCLYEVEWETEYACATDVLLGNFTSCSFTRGIHGIEIDLSPLNSDSSYHVAGDVNGTSTDFYINVCGGLGSSFACGESTWKINAVCARQTYPEVNQVLGQTREATLRYVDGNITLIYPGGANCPSDNSLQQSTLINFICNKTAANDGKGQPVFLGLLDCTYFFDWETKYACVNHPVASQCAFTSRGLNFDLGLLSRNPQESAWEAMDGQADDDHMKGKQGIYINVCGQVPRTHPDTAKCKADSSVCMTFDNNNAKDLGKFTNTPSYNPTSRSILLNYTSGDKCGSGQQTSSLVTFYCKPGQLESTPVLVRVSDDGCLYEFEWETAAACPQVVESGNDCRIVSDKLGFTIDLTPLKTQKYYEIPADQYSYFINVCGPVFGTPCDADSTHTPNVAACQVENERNPEGKQRFWKLGEPNTELQYYNGMINLTYSRGMAYNNKERTLRSATVAFLCDPEAGKGRPQFVAEANFAYVFEWYTKYACPPVHSVECSVTDRTTQKQYDLSRLARLSGSSNWEVADAYGNQRKTFYLNICRPLSRVIPGCTTSSAACMVDSAIGTSNTTAVSLGQALLPPQIHDGRLVLRYVTGDPCRAYGMNVTITTTLNFLCQKPSMSPALTYLGRVGQCEYSFLWVTEAACAVQDVAVQHGCKVSDPITGQVFDLSPLRKTDANYNVTFGSTLFELNVCGPLVGSYCADEKSPNPSVCKIYRNETYALGHEKESVLSFSDAGVLALTYNGPYDQDTGHVIKAVVHFRCQETPPSNPLTFVRQDSPFLYLFDFATSLACRPDWSSWCQFTDKWGRQFDLSPLALREGSNWEVEDPTPGRAGVRYHINFCRPLNKNPSYTCPGGNVGICMTNISLPSTVGIDIGHLNVTPQVFEDGTLTFQYGGGARCPTGNESISLIHLYCSEEQHNPVFVYQAKCLYVFHFVTPAACPLKASKGTECSITDPIYGSTYDLKPLRKLSGSYSVNAGEYRYLLNVCGPVRNVSQNCSGAAVCQTKVMAPSFAMDAGRPASNLSYYDGTIRLMYEGGQGFCHKKYNRTSVITFVCDHSTTGIVEGPRFVSESDECTYMFEWPTSYACPPYKTRKCSIEDDHGRVYDLNELSLPSSNHLTSSPLLPGKKFVINVCRSLIPKEGQVCSPSSGICMIDTEDGKTRSTSLGQIGRPRFENGVLSLQYTTGDICTVSNTSQTYRSIIQLECEPAMLIGEPEFVSKENCTYRFAWSTAVACPEGLGETFGSECSVTNPRTGFVYDIAVLRSATGYKVRSEDHEFQLNVCAELTNSSCGKGVGACQKELSGTKYWNMGKANTKPRYHDGVVTLEYEGGEPCHGQFPRKTVIHFVCGMPGTGQGRPVFVSESSDCVYSFVWHTEIVCEKKMRCAAEANGHTVDLSPLMSTNFPHIAVNLEDDASLYYLAVCRALTPIPGLRCPPNSAACLDVDGGMPVSLGSVAGPPTVDASGRVVLTYTQGSDCGGNRTNSALVIFVCNPSTYIGEPVFVSRKEDECLSVFEWETNIVCQDAVVPTTKPRSCSFGDVITGTDIDLSPLRTISPVKVKKGNAEYTLWLCSSTGSNRAGDCSGAAICLNDSRTEISLGRISSMNYKRDNNRLKLAFFNGSDCLMGENGRYSSEIIFICDPFAGLGTPSIHKNYSCLTVFVWQTSLACAPDHNECVVGSRGNVYNLRMLTSLSHNWNATDPQGHVYWLNICKGAEGTWPETGCLATSSVCRRDDDGHAISLGKEGSQLLSVRDNSTVVLTYTDNSSTACDPNGQQKGSVVTEIHFHCSSHLGRPVFSSGPNTTHCRYVFQWRTVAACASVSEQVIPEHDGIIFDPRLEVAMNISEILSRTYDVQEKFRREQYVYKINLNDRTFPDDDICGQAAVCQTKPDGSFHRDVGSLRTRRFLLKGAELRIVLTSNGRKCGKNGGKNVTTVIILQCSVTVGCGQPSFLYESNDCDYIFNWETSLVCPQNFIRGWNVTSSHHQIVAIDGHASEPRMPTGPIVLGVLLCFLLMALIGFVLAKKERRVATLSRVKNLCRRIPLPRLHYLKVRGPSQRNDAVLLVADGPGYPYQEEESDVDIIT